MEMIENLINSKFYMDGGKIVSIDPLANSSIYMKESCDQMRCVIQVCMRHVGLACKLEWHVTLGHMTPSYIYSRVCERVDTYDFAPIYVVELRIN